ncbi:MAG: DJ-1/PfpI family protein [Spirochaetes bacterium]|nr:DJ-1/PfpI family protein [Spirochaetota bacterium]
MTRVAMMLFPGVTIQDFVGPFEVLSRVENFKLTVFSPKGGELITETGLKISAEKAIDGVDGCDILFVPGGPGVNKILADHALIARLAALGAGAKYVTSVCTGSLILAAAGLLRGFHATSHWRYTDLLTLFGAVPAEGRVVVDRNRITGGGVTAGIDFALTLVKDLVSEQKAREIALQIEYDPDPPFRSGHPSVAAAATVNAVREKTSASYALRRKLMEDIVAAKLNL